MVEAESDVVLGPLYILDEFQESRDLFKYQIEVEKASKNGM